MTPDREGRPNGIQRRLTDVHGRVLSDILA